MPRYIDANALLARYKERCAGCKFTPNHCEHFCDIADVIDDIEDAPTVDAVEVVRCKDCKWKCYDAPPGIYYCMAKGNNGKSLNYDLMGYCDLAERKEKNDETN